MDRYDQVFASVASQHNGISDLLRTFFSFLNRRTDFYVVDPDTKRKMGFDEGQAEELVRDCSGARGADFVARVFCLQSHASRSLPSSQVLKAFRSFQYKGPDGRPLGGARAPPGKALTAAALASRVSPSPSPSPAPSTAPAADASRPSAASNAGAGPSPVPAPAPAPVAPVLTQVVRHTTGAGSDGIPSSSSSSSSASAGKQIPIGNGGVGPGYWWTQTLSEVTLFVQFPESTSAKEVECRVDAQRLRVGLRGRAVPVLDGPLSAAVKASEAMWNVETIADSQHRPVDPLGEGAAPAGSGAMDAPTEVGLPAPRGKVFTLTLDKAVETWWRSVVPGHPEIDATGVDSTQSVDSYDDETQAAIRKIMFDQAQKAKGLPTSEEMQMKELIERAKAAPGSPFLPGGELHGSPTTDLAKG
jgi:hypothetical protein